MENTTKHTNDYGYLNPITVDEMFRMIKASSPGVDISDLPVIEEARQEKEARTTNNSNGNRNGHSNGFTSSHIPDTPSSSYAHTYAQPQSAPAPNTTHAPTASASTETLGVPPTPKKDDERVTVRIMVSPKDGPPPTPSSTHELYELNPSLSYLQLHDTLRRFLLKHSKGDSRSRANLTGCIFTPDHQVYKIKAIWSNVNGGAVGDSAWGSPGAALPSSDTFITEDNCAVILNAMLKRAGALDTLVLITWVPED